MKKYAQFANRWASGPRIDIYEDVFPWKAQEM